MAQYLVDTNVVSDYLSGLFKSEAVLFMDGVMDDIPNLSIISQIELLCWSTDVETEQNIKNFIADSNVLNINSEVLNHCVLLRKSRKIKTPDAIIAATALAYEFVLVSANERDFANIKSLKVVNPHKI